MNATHLSYVNKTNLGSFYTPPHLVKLVYNTLKASIKTEVTGVVLEPACGYGSFFSVEFPFKKVRFVGSDIDPNAIKIAHQTFPHIEFKTANTLSGISREKLGIRDSERLIIVGNPPYNDITSRVKNGIKSEPCVIENDIKTRDLGLSFLLASAKLEPDYIAVLHPLSYIIKKANFEILKSLMKAYKLLECVVFSSQEFSDTSKFTGFPIIVAVYEKNASGTLYNDIIKWRFKTLENQIFSVSDFDYVCKYIPKYPSRHLVPSKYKFYTMRDINALKRSRTFIMDDTDNTIFIPPEKLHYYCYIDIFKDIITQLPYYFGNMDVPFDKEGFERIKDDFLTLSIAKHPEIFADCFVVPDNEKIDRANLNVSIYFTKLFSGMKICMMKTSRL